MLDGTEELIKHYYFLSGQRNFNGVIDFNAICQYLKIFPQGDEKLFIEVIYEVDRVIRKERDNNG